jgi:hypothetical protein
MGLNPRIKNEQATEEVELEILGAVLFLRS